MKIGIVLGVLVGAPYFVPFALEFVLIADLMGLEATIVFLALSGKHWWRVLTLRRSSLSQHVAETAALVAELYLFRPRVYLPHATVSAQCGVLAGSVFLFCMV